MTVNLLCSGPGPHVPASGIIGTGERAIAGLRCSSPACSPELDPAVQAQAAATNNQSTIQQQAQTALARNRAYAASTPTAAQVTTESKAHAQQLNGIIRLLLQQFDATN